MLITYGLAKSLEEIVWFVSFAVKTTFIAANLIANVNYAKIHSCACASRVAVVFSDALFVPREKKTKSTECWGIYSRPCFNRACVG